MAAMSRGSTLALLLLGHVTWLSWSNRDEALRPRRLRLQICLCGEHRPNATMDLEEVLGGIADVRFGFATFDDMVASLARKVMAPPNSSLHISSSGQMLHNFTEFDVAVASGSTLLQEHDDADELSVTVVWPDRYWVWPVPYIGHVHELPDVPKPAGVVQPVRLTVLSTEPRLFYVENFISKEECDELIEGAQDKFKRSVTGISNSITVLSQRTSQTHWDQTSDVSLRVQDRALAMTGISTEKRDLLDAVQVLKYGEGEEYRSHTDYFPKTEPRVGDQRSFDPQEKGGANRFLTILIYLEDLNLEQGGGTAFPKSQSLDGNNRTSMQDHGSVDSSGLCTAAASSDKNTLSCAKTSSGSVGGACVVTGEAGGQVVPARKGTAVLFYSQQPDGELDPNSVHAGCPVLAGTKYAANVWIWNRKFHQKVFVNESDGNSMKISFYNTFKDPVALYWEDFSGNEVKLADIGPEQSFMSRTFEGHKFISYTSQGRKVGVHTMDSNQPLVYIENSYLEVWFENDLSTAVDVFWINLDAKGKPQVPMGTIQVGKSLSMNTFVKHVFEFESAPHAGATPERRKYTASLEKPRVRISELGFSEVRRERSEL